MSILLTKHSQSIVFCTFTPSWWLQSCPIAATPLRTQERRRLRAMHPPKHDPVKPDRFSTHCSLNLEASCTNESEETSSSWQPMSACRQPMSACRHPMSACRHPACHMESLEHDGTRKSLPAKHSTIPDNTRQLCAASIGPVSSGLVGACKLTLVASWVMFPLTHGQL